MTHHSFFTPDFIGISSAVVVTGSMGLIMLRISEKISPGLCAFGCVTLGLCNIGISTVVCLNEYRKSIEKTTFLAKVENLAKTLQHSLDVQQDYVSRINTESKNN